MKLSSQCEDSRTRKSEKTTTRPAGRVIPPKMLALESFDDGEALLRSDGKRRGANEISGSQSNLVAGGGKSVADAEVHHR